MKGGIYLNIPCRIKILCVAMEWKSRKLILPDMGKFSNLDKILPAPSPWDAEKIKCFEFCLFKRHYWSFPPNFIVSVGIRNLDWDCLKSKELNSSLFVPQP